MLGFYDEAGDFIPMTTQNDSPVKDWPTTTRPSVEGEETVSWQLLSLVVLLGAHLHTCWSVQCKWPYEKM